jgi:hypothetical protein
MYVSLLGRATMQATSVKTINPENPNPENPNPEP